MRGLRRYVQAISSTIHGIASETRRDEVMNLFRGASVRWRAIARMKARTAAKSAAPREYATLLKRTAPNVGSLATAAKFCDVSCPGSPGSADQRLPKMRYEAGRIASPAASKTGR